MTSSPTSSTANKKSWGEARRVGYYTLYRPTQHAPISTIFTALFYPYIARERTAQNLILSVRSERSALCLKELHRSQNEGSLKSEERLSDFKERYAQLC